MTWFKRRAKCGHRTHLKATRCVFGEELQFDLTDEGRKRPVYCVDCLATKAIQCAWCSGVILPGEPVTVYSPVEEDYVPPLHAIAHNDTEGDEPLRLIGCLRWDCADSGADRAGFWVVGCDGKGYVHRVPTAFELLMQCPPGSAIFVRDLGDSGEIPTVW